MIKPLTFLQNVYAGHRAFVLGTGNSLRGLPLEFLDDEYTFGINRIGMTYLPTFYWLATRQVYDTEYRVDVDAAMRSAYYSFVATFLQGHIPEAQNTYWMQVSHIAGLNPTMPGDISVADWIKQDIAGCKISGYGHSGFAVIRLAAYMGFNPIYVLGMDGKYKYQERGQPDPNHFNEEYETGQFGRPEAIVDAMNQRIKDSHNIMRLGALVLDVEILNTGRNSPLKQYPKVKFEELFK